MRSLQPSIALAVAFACVAPAGAGAVTLGTTEQPTAFPAQRCDQPRWGTGHVHYQATPLFGTPSSVAPVSGSITSWRSDQWASGVPGGTLTLVVLRPTALGEMTIVASDTQTLPATITRDVDVVFTPATPVGIAAGDTIGLYGNDDRSGCFFSGGRNSEQWGHAEIGALAIGTTFRPTVQITGRVDLAAEVSPGGAGPTPPADPTPPAPPPPGPPRIDATGRGSVSRGGQVGTGQIVGCSEAGPCTVVTTALVYYGPGQVVAAAAAKRSGARARRPKPVVVGRRSFTVPAGGSAPVTFPLNRAGRSGLRRFGRLRLVVTTTVRQGTAAGVAARRVFTIRAPRTPRRHARH